jgi:hypothetical protein
MNLRRETAEMLKGQGKTAADVCWVQWGEFHCSWDEFVAAANFDYDNGYGGNEIPMDLKVVGTDWWLERGEYDGSEWWEFKTMPIKPELHRVPVEKDLHE